MKEKSSQDRTIDLTDIGGIRFEESSHSYFNKEGERYKGITTLLKKYEHEFDDEIGSLNSAIKDVIIRTFGEQKFNELKKLCKQEGLRMTKDKEEHKFVYGHHFLHTKLNSIILKYPNLKEDILLTKQRLLKEWRDKSEESIRIGSLEHDAREQEIKQKGYFYNGVHYQYIEGRNIMNVKTDENVVIPECLVWNHKLKLGGLGDLFLFNKSLIHVHDYKTNELIERESFNRRAMKGVCSTLMDCNFYHYSLQLKIYQAMALMLRRDFKVGENLIINTKSELYGRNEDILIGCHNVEREVRLIFNELKSELIA